MKLTTKQLTLCGVLTTLALALSVAENQLPLTLAIPIPGIKLGLANIVTVFALYALGPAQAVLILLARCTLGALFAGNMNALLFSLMGGLAAMGMMILLSRRLFHRAVNICFPSAEQPPTTAGRWRRQCCRWATPHRCTICRFCWGYPC